MALPDMVHHGRTEFIGRGEGAEHRKYDGHFSLCLIQEKLQILLLPGQGPFIHGYRLEPEPVLRFLHRRLCNPGHAAFGYIAEISFGSEILDAVHAIIHGFQNIHIIFFIEIVGMLCIAHRIQVYHRQMGPQGIGHPVHFLAADGRLDAFLLRHGRNNFLFHRIPP